MMKSSKKYYIDNNVEELAAKLSKTIILDGGDENNTEKPAAAPPTLPRIRDVKSFDSQIGVICESLFRTLTSKQLEATCQRCLAIDLQQAGIEVLAQEREIKLQYKGQDVGTRRADIVLQTPSDKQWIVLELKAVATLTSEHLKQLEFYMLHLDIDIGYLINFPHDMGFPDLPTTAMYRQTILSGVTTEMLSDRNTRARHANSQVQIIKVERVVTNEHSSDHRPYASKSQSLDDLLLPRYVKSTANHVVARSAAAATTTTSKSAFIVPIAKKTGEPCKICKRLQTYCQYHCHLQY